MNPSSVLTTIEPVDKAFYVIFGISGLSLLGIIIAMVYFIWRYNRKREPVPLSQKDHNVWLEVTWTVIPTILVLVMFWYGWEGYLSLRRIPDNAMHVKATARMWSWLFTYDNGKTADKLFVPVGQPVKVELIAEDVLHSFYVPAFRVKRDCVPGMVNYAWFIAEKPGSYDLFCAEYCGVGHADMITTVEAMSEPDFQEWLSVLPSPEDAGKDLLQKHGCLGCHSLDGSRMVGPSFKGIGGREVVVVTNGQERTLTTDAEYLKRAILEPNADIVQGYPPAMPGYDGRIPEDELNAIIDYLLNQLSSSQLPDVETSENKEKKVTETTGSENDKDRPTSEDEDGLTGSAAEPPVQDTQEERGRAVAQQNGCLGCHSLDGSRMVGPSFKGLYGSERVVEQAGQTATIVAEDEYLIESIRDPGVLIVQGYPPAMPAYPGLSDDDLEALLAWLKTLK